LGGEVVASITANGAIGGGRVWARGSRGCHGNQNQNDNLGPDYSAEQEGGSGDMDFR